MTDTPALSPRQQDAKARILNRAGLYATAYKAQTTNGVRRWEELADTIEEEIRAIATIAAEEAICICPTFEDGQARSFFCPVLAHVKEARAGFLRDRQHTDAPASGATSRKDE